MKNSEFFLDKQRLKGRVCFRAPTATDESGSIAIFQVLNSRPTTITAVNVAVAWGFMVGHKVMVADAVRAYVQSDLRARHPTYIEFPRHVIPKRWRYLRRPVCRLLKALYGHPEAGAHWERHLRRIV